MRILLTGSAGFIGSVIKRKLLNQGHNVVSIDKKTGVDCRDFFRENDRFFDLVIHCAAIVGGRILVESPVAHAENLEIDAGLFQWAERTKPSRIVYVSSVAAYPVSVQCCPPPIGENEIELDNLWDIPDQLYGWAKLTGELLASRSSIPVSIPRPFTVYGEDQDQVYPFANIMGQVRAYKDPVTIWGSGDQVRDFIHVDDVATGILEMAFQGIDGPVNFCTGIATSLKELARRAGAAQSWLGLNHHYDPVIETLPDKPEGLPFRVGDPRRLHEFYKPRISLQEGIERDLGLR